MKYSSPALISIKGSPYSDILNKSLQVKGVNVADELPKKFSYKQAKKRKKRKHKGFKKKLKIVLRKD